MDTRAARRAAEQAARDLINGRAALVGELGVMGAERHRLTQDVATAAAHGRQLVAEAEAEAARLVTAAQDLAQDREQRYADAYLAATAGGWTTADLTALGFQPTAIARGRRVPVEQPEIGLRAPAVPQQPSEQDLRQAASTLQ